MPGLVHPLPVVEQRPTTRASVATAGLIAHVQLATETVAPDAEFLTVPSLSLPGKPEDDRVDGRLVDPDNTLL